MLSETIVNITGIGKKKNTPIKVVGKDRVVTFSYVEHCGRALFKSLCGEFFCTAVGYRATWLNTGWEKTKNMLCTLGMSYQEAEEEIAISKGIESIYLYHNLGRERYINSNKPLLGFGDWGILKKEEMDDIAGYYSCGPIKKCKEYAVKILRDESGIPLFLYLSTTDGKFIGQICTGLTDSKNVISFSREIDTVPWGSRWVGAQSDRVAYSLRSIAMGSNLPIGVINSSGSEPVFSVKPSSILFVLENEDKPDRIINFVSGNPPVFVYRLPMGSDSLLDSRIIKFPEKHCRTIEKDLISYSDKNGGIDFLSNVMLSGYNICPSVKSSILEGYAKKTGIGIDALNKAKESSGGESCPSVCGRKIIFRSGGKYFSTSNKKGVKEYAVSNFVFLPDVEHLHESGNRIEGVLICGGIRSRIYVALDKIVKFKEFLSFVSEECSLIGAPPPVITQPEDTQNVRKIILRGVELSAKKKMKYPGFDRKSGVFVSSWGDINKNSVYHVANNLGGIIDPLLRVTPSMVYGRLTKARLREWASDCPQSAKAMFIFLRALRSGMNGKPSVFFMGEEQASIFSGVLGIRDTDGPATKGLVGFAKFPVSRTDAVSSGGLVTICHDAPYIEKGPWSFTFNDFLSVPPSGPYVFPILFSEFLSGGVFGTMNYAYGKDHGYGGTEDNKLEVREAGTLKDFLDALRGTGQEDDVVKVFDGGHAEINLSLSSALLKKSGIKFNRKKVLAELESTGSLLSYPVRKYKTRSTCAVVKVHALSG